MIDAGLVVDTPDGLTVVAEGQVAALPPICLQAGQWLVVTPPAPLQQAKLASAVARTLASSGLHQTGRLHLLGVDVRKLSYMALLQLRSRIGYVYSHGGLLANRTVQDNIAFPLVFRNELADDAVADRTAAMLVAFGLTALAQRRPHQLDAGERYRVCAARAVAGSPRLVVVEGAGDFADGEAIGQAWPALMAQSAAHAFALVVALSQVQPTFEAWMLRQGGQVVRWQRAPTQPMLPDEVQA